MFLLGTQNKKWNHESCTWPSANAANKTAGLLTLTNEKLLEFDVLLGIATQEKKTPCSFQVPNDRSKVLNEPMSALSRNSSARNPRFDFDRSQVELSFLKVPFVNVSLFQGPPSDVT